LFQSQKKINKRIHTTVTRHELLERILFKKKNSSTRNVSLEKQFIRTKLRNYNAMLDTTSYFGVYVYFVTSTLTIIQMFICILTSLFSLSTILTHSKRTYVYKRHMTSPVALLGPMSTSKRQRVHVVPRCRSPNPCLPQQQDTICCKKSQSYAPEHGQKIDRNMLS